jgi:hypothetical protein
LLTKISATLVGGVVSTLVVGLLTGFAWLFLTEGKSIKM